MTGVRVHQVNFHAGDWLSGVRMLNATERGVYMTVIALIYDAGGPIDISNEDLAHECRMSEEELSSVLARLVARGKLYRKNPGVFAGFLSNERCEEEIARARTRIEAAKANGKRGGRPSKEAEKPKSLEYNDNQDKGWVNLALDPLNPNETQPKPSEKLLLTTTKKEDTSLREGAKAPSQQDLLPVNEPSLEKRVFDLGVSVLGQKGRGMVAKLRKHLGFDDQKTYDLLMAAKGKASPVEWIGACMAKSPAEIVIPRRFVPKEENPTCWGYMVKGHGCDERFAHIPTHELDDDDEDQRREGYRRVNAPGAFA